MEQRINYLLKQFTADALSPEEKQELLVLAADPASAVSDEIVKMIMAEEAATTEVAVTEKWEAVLNNILATDKPKKTPRSILLRPLKWAAAAAVLVVFSFTAYLSLNKKKEHVFASDVAPGKNKAILTLADGRKISLSDAANGDLIEQAGVSISKTANGQLVYHIQKTTGDIDDSKVNTISTPNGGEWEIRLPDGSVVWLNAASSLQYPLNIGSSKQRKVELSGEAYFEVAKDKAHPFIVKTLKQELEVLGTHFNINSYANEIVTRTTLLEGSVRISDLSSNDMLVLKPGEQSVLSKNGIEIKKANTDEAIAWKNGYFMFDNEKQESILRKIARWYNVEIEYADPEAKEVMYYGTVSRFEKISKVLRKFEQTGEVRFDIKGNKIIVYKE
ncbi:FecR family protein [Pedobacter sp. HDW13]|uniref:FecR family protein n=1 Tax=Pedobacter sp. HDW13 TaxID=2714940 RepID=UPI00140BD5FC|nr:FecR family protein [Pedobacter sp. HDW13]QIL38967.1 FecR family protein [Pedobacter sp. HDW13]